MPNTREKLIELMREADNKCMANQCESCSACGKGEDCVNYNIADHLIANGVTLANQVASSSKQVASKWIPVTERLPEYEQEVLTYRGESGISVERMFPGAMWDLDYDLIDSVTHWMPLPEPPKGE